MLRIEFLTDLGARVSVDVEHEGRLLEVQRHYGRLGWTSGEIPSGGYQFPLDNEPDFDWTLLGARKWTSPDGEELVIHRGHAYRRRELEAVDSRKLKLPAAIKYSRGAKVSDPPPCPGEGRRRHRICQPRDFPGRQAAGTLRGAGPE